MPGTDEELDESDPMMRRLSPCPYLRRGFTVPRERAPRDALRDRARRARAGELNGARVGDAVLAPGWTDYRERIEYAAHDVTALVRAG